jgi:type III secretion protein U
MAEKRHKPTPKRLRDARKRGEVVFSSDVATTAVFAFVLAGLWLLGSRALDLFSELWLQATDRAVLAAPGTGLPQVLGQAAEAVVIACVVACAVAAVGGILGSFFQVGGVAGWEQLKPDVNRMNPAEGLKRIFSSESLINLVKMVVKTLLLAVLMVVVVRSHLESALRLGYLNAASVLAVMAHALLVTFAWAGVIYAAMSVADYAHQHYEFMKRQRMSFEEIQREHKDIEGDPINRFRRRSAHLEAVYASLADRVRAASAVICSRRVAIALQYLGETDLPRVIARGEGEVAMQIRRFAAEALIPTEMDASLAERLYDDAPIDQHIPRALYAPVAKLLRWAQGDH